jgi:hypothetical protein
LRENRERERGGERERERKKEGERVRERFLVKMTDDLHIDLN